MYQLFCKSEAGCWNTLDTDMDITIIKDSVGCNMISPAVKATGFMNINGVKTATLDFNGLAADSPCQLNVWAPRPLKNFNVDKFDAQFMFEKVPAVKIWLMSTLPGVESLELVAGKLRFFSKIFLSHFTQQKIIKYYKKFIKFYNKKIFNKF